jgi:cytidylate kinase
MFNVITLTREYGSGGAEIGRRLARMLGWELLDRKVIERVAAMGKVDIAWAEEADGTSTAWWERLLSGFRYGGPQVYLGGVEDTEIDRDALQKFTAQVIEEAAKVGNCVIVGRSSQCVLHNEPRALHTMIYAPLEEKLERMKHRHPYERDLQALLHHIDAERIRYARDYFGRDSTDRQLYHLCLSSKIGLDTCAELIMSAVRSSGRQQEPESAETPI